MWSPRRRFRESVKVGDGERALTFSKATQSSSRASICECSCLLTAAGDVYSAVSHCPRFSWRSCTARFTTAHHIGTVLDSASGSRLPERVESTKIRLCRY